MPSEQRSPSDKARESVEQLLRTVIATSGIMLALLWGLIQRTTSAAVIPTIRHASVVLVLAVAGSLLGLQFVVTELERNTQQITKRGTVAFTFVAAWISFLAGCVLLIVAIYRFR